VSEARPAPCAHRSSFEVSFASRDERPIPRDSAFDDEFAASLRVATHRMHGMRRHVVEFNTARATTRPPPESDWTLRPKLCAQILVLSDPLRCPGAWLQHSRSLFPSSGPVAPPPATLRSAANRVGRRPDPPPPSLQPRWRPSAETSPSPPYTKAADEAETCRLGGRAFGESGSDADVCNFGRCFPDRLRRMLYTVPPTTTPMSMARVRSMSGRPKSGDTRRSRSVVRARPRPRTRDRVS
jgi:hypothetical protein